MSINCTQMPSGRSLLLENQFPSSIPPPERPSLRSKVNTLYLILVQLCEVLADDDNFIISPWDELIWLCGFLLLIRSMGWFHWLVLVSYFPTWTKFGAACTQEEVNKIIETAKTAQKSWAKTPLWKRAELLHKAAAILKEHKAPIAECLVKEIAKPAKDAVTEVCRTKTFTSF